jgi:hypothetical protein
MQVGDLEFVSRSWHASPEGLVATALGAAAIPTTILFQQWLDQVGSPNMSPTPVKVGTIWSLF